MARRYAPRHYPSLNRPPRLDVGGIEAASFSRSEVRPEESKNDLPQWSTWLLMTFFIVASVASTIGVIWVFLIIFHSVVVGVPTKPWN